jgi:hypothetical protein
MTGFMLHDPMTAKGGTLPDNATPPDWLKNLHTRGDVAAASIGFGLGLVVDYALLHVGVPPGSAALTGAVMAVGLKNGAQGRWEARREWKRLRKTATRLQKLILDSPLVADSEEMQDLARDLKKEIDLWVSGATSNQEFGKILSDAANRYRDIHPPDRHLAA